MATDSGPLRAFIDAQPDLVLVLLFGSFGTISETPDSDVDIAVLARERVTSERRTELIESLAQITGRAIDLVDLRVAGLPLQRSVLTTGRTLLARDPTARGTLLARYLIDAADFLPYYERILRQRREAWIG